MLMFCLENSGAGSPLGYTTKCRKMLKNAIEYAEICCIYANFCICRIISTYTILKAGDLCVLAKYAIAYSHITGITNCGPGPDQCKMLLSIQ